MLDGDASQGNPLLGYKSRGKIDELMILTRAVSEPELQEIYERGLRRRPLGIADSKQDGPK
jgi:hypothetical protein